MVSNLYTGQRHTMFLQFKATFRVYTIVDGRQSQISACTASFKPEGPTSLIIPIIDELVRYQALHKEYVLEVSTSKDAYKRYNGLIKQSLPALEYDSWTFPHS